MYFFDKKVSLDWANWPPANERYYFQKELTVLEEDNWLNPVYYIRNALYKKQAFTFFK